jgi:hypothetical protein
MRVRQLLMIFAGALTCISAWAQSIEDRRLPAITATRLGPGETIHIDGDFDDAVWARTPPVREFFEYRPRESAAAKYPSEVRIAYDQHALYLGLTATDPDTSKLDAPLVRRDRVEGSQDFFAIHIDPVGTRKFAQIFRVNAAGAISDGLYNEDTGNEDYSPDFEFEVRTRITPTGWQAEMRIPFSTLRYSDPPSANWTILVVRGIARDEQYRIANARIPRDANCFQCYAQPLTGMLELPPGRELTVTPQMTLRRTSDRINNGGTSNKNSFIAGADIKLRPRADLVFDATINPDFSQVELDTPQLAANAQFALFFPEKRPFFLEGTDILASPFNGAIYTRSITDPAWGARLTRRFDASDFTFLTTRDDGKGLILLPNALGTDFASQDSKSQASIFRYRTHHGTWSAGALVTDRSYESAPGLPAAYNRVIGTDFVWRPSGEARVRGQILVSDTKDPRNPRGDLPRTDSAALLDYFYRDALWNFEGGVERVGRGFRADNGFFGQAGYNNAYQTFQRKWLEVGVFNEVSPYVNLAYKSDDKGRVLYQQVVPGLFLAAARNTNIGIEFRPNTLVRFRNEGSPLKRDQFFASIETSPGTWLSRYYIEAAVGDRADVANNANRRGYYIGANATLRLSNHWEIEPRIDESVMGKTDIRPGPADFVIRERAIQVTSVYHFTARDNLRFIGQYNGVKRNLAYFAPGFSADQKTETLSIVYGHLRGLGTNIYIGANTSRSKDPDAGFKRRQNEIFVKASWAFDLADWIS